MKNISSSAGDASRKVSNLLISIALFALLVGAPPCSLTLGLARAQTSATQAGELTVVVEDIPELHRTIVSTPHGKLFLNLPKHATPGSEVSGTLFAEPAGQTLAEKEKNAAVLNRYVVEVGGQRVTAGGVAFKVNTAVRDATNVVINVPKDIKLKPKALALPPPDPPTDIPKEFLLPSYGQAGGFLAIRGPFDGEVAASDQVIVGGKPALTLAESTTSKVVLNNSDTVGSTRIEVREQARLVSGDYRNITVNLAITKPTTTSGEQSTLTLRVDGLRGLTKSIPIDLENRSPTVTRMERGDRQLIMIRPADVQPDGTFTQTLLLTSLHSGAFIINATVVAQSAEGTPQGDAAGPRPPQR